MTREHPSPHASPSKVSSPLLTCFLSTSCSQRPLGPLVYLRLFTQDVYVINSPHVAAEILDKQSSKSADRPRAQLMVGELSMSVLSVPCPPSSFPWLTPHPTPNSIGWNNGVALSPAGTRHREYRKLLSTSLNTAAARRPPPRAPPARRRRPAPQIASRQPGALPRARPRVDREQHVVPWTSCSASRSRRPGLIISRWRTMRIISFRRRRRRIGLLWITFPRVSARAWFARVYHCVKPSKHDVQNGVRMPYFSSSSGIIKTLL